MISSLSLNNVALIKKQQIDFDSGFNCLLGQSGAGKSIIIDALNFSLGGKSDKSLIRTGETALRVDAVFNCISEEVVEFLKEQDIEVEDELIVTRSLNSDGKSTVRINGYPATVKILQELGSLLVDFCGQHDNVGLLNMANHLSLLDKFAGDEIVPIKTKVSQLFENLKDIESQISQLGGNQFERERAKELLEYQIQEIENANLEVGEDVTLKERYDFISSAEKIFDKVSSAIEKISEQRENATSLIYEAKSELNSISTFKGVEDCRTRLENAYYELKDVADVLEELKSEAEFDPRELERIDSRLDHIKALSKKYGKTVEDILNYLAECKHKLEDLNDSEFRLEKLTTEKEKCEQQLLNECEALSQSRKKFAKILETEIVKQLDELEMKGTYFKVEFEKCAPSRKGTDAVKFMFSANKGQDAKDLHKTASGGELSRVLLAFKNSMLDKEKVQTVVFDEIDSGISGHTAGKLAEKLANISQYMQVVCITHTAVVAAKAKKFLLVEKSVVGDTTISTARSISGEDVVVEIARLIDGGVQVSSTAINHAKELLK